MLPIPTCALPCAKYCPSFLSFLETFLVLDCNCPGLPVFCERSTRFRLPIPFGRPSTAAAAAAALRFFVPTFCCSRLCLRLLSFPLLGESSQRRNPPQRSPQFSQPWLLLRTSAIKPLLPNHPIEVRFYKGTPGLPERVLRGTTSCVTSVLDWVAEMPCESSSGALGQPKIFDPVRCPGHFPAENAPHIWEAQLGAFEWRRVRRPESFRGRARLRTLPLWHVAPLNSGSLNRHTDLAISPSCPLLLANVFARVSVEMDH